MVIVSAPGKVHLIGEHAVVGGYPAILAAVGLRTTVECKSAKNIQFHDVRFPGATHAWSLKEVQDAAKETMALWHACAEKKDFVPLLRHVKSHGYETYRKSVVGIVYDHLGLNQGSSISIRSDVPTGSGLGSSSSLAVALTKAIAEAHSIKITDERLNEIAYELEKIIHGTPSGGDNATSCFGGLVWFQKGQKENTIKPLEKEIPLPLKNFVLVYTKAPEKTTGELVQMVRNLDQEYREKRFSSIGSLVQDMKAALKKKDYARVKEIINQTQGYLKELGVSIPEIDNLHEAIKKIGGGSKLCGAGGGGIILCLHENKKELVNLIRAQGYEPIETELGASGVRIEHS